MKAKVTPKKTNAKKSSDRFKISKEPEEINYVRARFYKEGKKSKNDLATNFEHPLYSEVIEMIEKYGNDRATIYMALEKEGFTKI